jgi:uroporphyrin-III C-methyltransferase
VRVIDVGKRGGCASTPQPFIDRLMARLAKRGAIVGRVKGGDPYVFGRGAEEVAALEAAGVLVEVVSGVTAGIAVPAALGIPVTSRHLACGVTLVTGHAREGGPEPDWAALARGGTTLVIYMGVRRLADIATALLGAGMPAATPAAAIQNGTLPQQASIVSTLGSLPRDVVKHGIRSPAIVVIGEVVALARPQGIADSDEAAPASSWTPPVGPALHDARRGARRPYPRPDSTPRLRRESP